MGFINIFSKRATGLHRWAKLFEMNFLSKKTFPLDGQTRWPKSFSQPVNLPGARPLMKPLLITFNFTNHTSLQICTKALIWGFLRNFCETLPSGP